MSQNQDGRKTPNLPSNHNNFANERSGSTGIEQPGFVNNSGTAGLHERKRTYSSFIVDYEGDDCSEIQKAADGKINTAADGTIQLSSATADGTVRQSATSERAASERAASNIAAATKSDPYGFRDRMQLPSGAGTFAESGKQGASSDTITLLEAELPKDRKLDPNWIEEEYRRVQEAKKPRFAVVLPEVKDSITYIKFFNRS